MLGIKIQASEFAYYSHVINVKRVVIRCLFEGTGLSDNYYLKKLLITSSTLYTSYEKSEGQKPDFSNFKTFGSKALLLTTKVKRGQLDNKTVSI